MSTAAHPTALQARRQGYAEGVNAASVPLDNLLEDLQHTWPLRLRHAFLRGWTQGVFYGALAGAMLGFGLGMLLYQVGRL